VPKLGGGLRHAQAQASFAALGTTGQQMQFAEMLAWQISIGPWRPFMATRSTELTRRSEHFWFEVMLSSWPIEVSAGQKLVCGRFTVAG
jgi:hypothetical protein